MKDTLRLQLYELCKNYVKTITILREYAFLDPHLKCDDCPEKLEAKLKRLEKAMSDTLQGG